MRVSKSIRSYWFFAGCVAITGCAHQGPSPLLTLRRVVLNQSGSGYFERSGTVTGDRLALRLKSHEVDDVLATLTVLEQGDNPRQTVVAAGVPHASDNGRDEAVSLDLRLPDNRARNLLVSYAVPTANWQATYRVVLPDHEGGPALLQVWALVHNSSDEDWNHVEMTLATGAPLSFAFHLRTPSYTSRPDATGAVAPPVVNAPVLSEGSTTPEATRQLLPGAYTGLATSANADDLTVGRYRTAAADRDRDGVLDANDHCPDAPETFNGTEDTDGCPDTGSVRVSASQIRIVQSISFDLNSAELAPRALPLMEQIASVLRGNPSIQSLEVQGSASSDEADPWNLALNRAATIRARLIAMGISADRLRVRSFGTSHPIGSNESVEGRAQNRYAGFHIVDTPAPDPAASPGGTGRGGVSVANLASSASSNASAREFLGATRYVVSAPVSIAASTAALVTIASREVPGEDVYLFRPESATPSSSEHPYRAARIRNHTGMTLLPGPVALFAGGTFAGEGLLQRLHDDETTFIPYAIDPSTTVAVRFEDAREPHRVLSLVRNVVTLEDTAIHHARYTIDPGAQAPSRIYLRHDHLEGYTPRGLPPDSEQGRNADLVPVPLTARQQSVLTIDQTRPTTRTLSLVDDITTDVTPYLAATTDALRQPLLHVLELRTSLARFERQSEELREQLADVAERNAEIRETLRTLVNVTDQARLELRTRLTRQLQESMTRHATLSHDLAARTDSASSSRTQLIDALRGLRVEAEPVVAATH